MMILRQRPLPSEIKQLPVITAELGSSPHTDTKGREGGEGGYSGSEEEEERDEGEEGDVSMGAGPL